MFSKSFVNYFHIIYVCYVCIKIRLLSKLRSGGIKDVYLSACYLCIHTCMCTNVKYRYVQYSFKNAFAILLYILFMLATYR